MLSKKKKLEILSAACSDKKGLNIVCLDVREISPITDYLIIASGTSDRHVKALAEGVLDSLDEMGETYTYCASQEDGDWALVDTYDIMVHLFKESAREYYAIEELWRTGKKIDLE